MLISGVIFADHSLHLGTFRLDPNYDESRPASGKSNSVGSPTPELKGRGTSAPPEHDKARISDKSPAIKTLDLPLQPLVSRAIGVIWF